MATSVRPQPPLSEALQFRPRWWWDPVPDWVLEHMNPAAIREIAVIQLTSQLETMQIQQKALEASIAVIRKQK
jgi:hypothetical protein